MKLSLICPTLGRNSLLPLLKTVVKQLKPGDEFIIVADGPISPEATELLTLTPKVCPQVKFIPLPVRIGDYGCTPCDLAIGLAEGDAVFFIGDDDRVADNAFETIRRALIAQPDRPHLFSMYHTNRVLGRTLASCQVSGQQIVIPRDMSKMPKMADVSEDQWLVSDWVFITKVHEAWDRTTVFHDDIIAYLDKQNFGKMV